METLQGRCTLTRTRTQLDSVEPVVESSKVSKRAAVCCLWMKNLEFAVGLDSYSIIFLRPETDATDIAPMA